MVGEIFISLEFLDAYGVSFSSKEVQFLIVRMYFKGERGEDRVIVFLFTPSSFPGPLLPYSVSLVPLSPCQVPLVPSGTSQKTPCKFLLGPSRGPKKCSNSQLYSLFAIKRNQTPIPPREGLL
jgi:hypothetical protein